jgi:flagellar biogenesis protein FliO
MRAVPGQVLLLGRVGVAFFERRLSLLILFIILLEYVIVLVVILFRFNATKAISYCDSESDGQTKQIYIISYTVLFSQCLTV